MRVFLAGATGVIGRPLLTRLLEAGHHVTGMTRSPAGAELVRTMGGVPVVCNVFDTMRLQQAIAEAKPEVVIHELTDIPKRPRPRRVKKEFATTNRLRTEGTQALADATIGAGARRLIAQSWALFYDPRIPGPATEEDPLYLDAPAAYIDIIRAIDVGDRTVLGVPGLEGVVLRYGNFYGPGTVYAHDGSFAQDVRQRRIPMVGEGSATYSFVHVDDAAEATMAALEGAEPGIYNVVDDEPALYRDWLPHYAELLGAQPPRKVPRFLMSLFGGSYGLFLVTEQRGASNAKAKEALGWTPSQPTWREGFRAELLA